MQSLLWRWVFFSVYLPLNFLGLDRVHGHSIFHLLDQQLLWNMLIGRILHNFYLFVLTLTGIMLNLILEFIFVVHRVNHIVQLRVWFQVFSVHLMTRSVLLNLNLLISMQMLTHVLVILFFFFLVKWRISSPIVLVTR